MRIPIFIPAAVIVLATTGPLLAQQRTAAIDDTALSAQACNVCHGNASHTSSTMPPIRGVDAATLYTALIELKADTRPSTIMGRIARGYSDEQLKALADYLSKN